MVHGKLDIKVCSHIQLGIIQPSLHSALPTGVSMRPALIDGSTDTVPVEISNLSQGRNSAQELVELGPANLTADEGGTFGNKAYIQL